MTQRDRILIADDDLTNRRILVVSLEKAGYATCEAADGYEAVDVATESPPDLVLLDVNMPGLDGFEVCEFLKANAATADVPVIFITALACAEDMERGFALGGSDYVTKPFHMGEVKARVSVHLRLRRAEAELREAHAELLHAQKLESIGQLAAGIAHEINTPTQYVGDNTRFLRDVFGDLDPLLEAARGLAAAVRAGDDAVGAAEELERAFVEADFDALRDEIPAALGQSIEGLERVARIVRAMKDFSHPGAADMELADLNHLVESTVLVASSEWKYVAEMETDLAPDLPLVPCLPGELGQVVLNVLVNAAHAIADVVGQRGDKGRITIRTRRDEGHAELRVTDTGGGIPEAVRPRIFDPFFTTKEVGKGTGQGLSIARGVVVQKHHGTLDFETELGRGTTFVVRLPLSAERPGEAA